MGRIFFLAFFTLCFLMLHARASSTKSELYPSTFRSRILLQDPKPEQSIAESPLGKEPTFSGGDVEGGEMATTADAPVESESRKLGRHRSPDKSVAGGGVILGGLVTAIFASVYCYIRVTRRRQPFQKI